MQVVNTEHVLACRIYLEHKDQGDDRKHGREYQLRRWEEDVKAIPPQS